MKDLFVVTHAQSLHHAENLVGGWYDTGLTPRGEAGATFVISAWIKMPIEAVGFVSFPAKSGSITHLRQDDYWRSRAILRLADASHIEE